MSIAPEGSVTEGGASSPESVEGRRELRIALPDEILGLALDEDVRLDPLAVVERPVRAEGGHRGELDPDPAPGEGRRARPAAPPAAGRPEKGDVPPPLERPEEDVGRAEAAFVHQEDDGGPERGGGDGRGDDEVVPEAELPWRRGPGGAEGAGGGLDGAPLGRGPVGGGGGEK